MTTLSEGFKSGGGFGGKYEFPPPPPPQPLPNKRTKLSNNNANTCLISNFLLNAISPYLLPVLKTADHIYFISSRLFT